jgi:hypothetical protein
MKFSKLSLSILAGSLALASAAFAGPANKGKLHLAETVTVEGKQLKPDDYSLAWDGQGSDVKLNITRGHDTVTVPAKLDASTEHVRDGYGTKNEADGSKSLTAVYVGGKKYQIAPDQSATATPAR